MGKMGRNPFQKAEAKKYASESRTKQAQPEPSPIEDWLASNLITRTVMTGLKGLLVLRYFLRG